MFFDNPAVRFSRRLSFYQIRMRYLRIAADSLADWCGAAIAFEIVPGAMRRSFQRRRRLLTSYLLDLWVRAPWTVHLPMRSAQTTIG